MKTMQLFSGNEFLHDTLKASILTLFQSILPADKNIHIQGLLGVTINNSQVIMLQLDEEYDNRDESDDEAAEKEQSYTAGVKRKRLSMENENDESKSSSVSDKSELFPKTEQPSDDLHSAEEKVKSENDIPINPETLPILPLPSEYNNPYLSNIIKSIQSSPCNRAFIPPNASGNQNPTGEASTSDITNPVPDPVEAARQAARMMLLMGQLPDTSHLEKVKEKKEKVDRNYLSIAEKLKVIEARKEGISHRELAKRFKIGKTQVTNIMKKKDFYLEAHKYTCDINRKRAVAIRTANEDINAMTFKWYMEETANGRVLSGAKIQEKALMFAEVLGMTNFKASNGWLDSFKKRHGIVTSNKKDKKNTAESSEILGTASLYNTENMTFPCNTLPTNNLDTAFPTSNADTPVFPTNSLETSFPTSNSDTPVFPTNDLETSFRTSNSDKPVFPGNNMENAFAQNSFITPSFPTNNFDTTSNNSNSTTEESRDRQPTASTVPTIKQEPITEGYDNFMGITSKKPAN